MNPKNPLNTLYRASALLALLLALPIKGAAAPTEIKVNTALGEGVKPVVVQTGQQNSGGLSNTVVPTLGGGVLPGVDAPILEPGIGAPAEAARVSPRAAAAQPGVSPIDAAAPAGVARDQVRVVPASRLPAASASKEASAKGAAPAPAVGNAAFQQGLQRVQNGASDIGAALRKKVSDPNAVVEASVVGGALFDGTGRRSAANFADQSVGADGRRGPPRGFGGTAGNGSGRRFQSALVRLGVPRAAVQRLSGLMVGWHPGDQSGVYHGLPHSFAVADMLAQILDGPEGARYATGEKVELLLAAALHDVDPERESGKPARVAATLEYLADNDAARGLVAEFEPYGASLERVQTLIKFTDFNMDAAAMAQIKRDAAAMAVEHFSNDPARGAKRGELLAYVDKSAMYTGSFAFARDAVIGLANEIGAPKEAILRGTPGFLKGLIWQGEPRASAHHPLFERLPAELRENFLEVYGRFEREASLDGASAPDRDEDAKGELSASLEAAIDAVQGGLRRALGVARSVNPIAGRSAADSRAPPAFAAALEEAGVPRPLTGRLTGLLLGWHPGDQGKVYHGVPHTFRVADTAAEILKGSLGRAATKEERVLMLLAAALHDVDPTRAPGSPARVAATLEFLREDPSARRLVEDFAPYGANAQRLAALIKFTDFSMDPSAMAQIQRDAASMAEAHFADPARGRVLGRALAYADKTAMYVDTVEFAEKSVRGLAAEIGAPEEAILAGTAGFLRGLIYADQSETKFAPEFSLLPKDLQENFLRTYAHFKTLAPKSAPTKDGVTTRGPPSSPDKVSRAVEAVRRYTRSIAAGLTLSDKQRYGLMEMALEEQRISKNDPLWAQVEAQLFPERAERNSAARQAIAAQFKNHAPLIIELAEKFGKTTREVEAIIKSQPEVARLLSGKVPEAQARTQLSFALQRDRVRAMTSRFPDNEQGRFLRELGETILTPGGKSIEEIVRSGAFAYVSFRGRSVASTAVGRDPDVQSSDYVFYVLLEADGRWTVNGYRKNNSRLEGSDREWIAVLENWLKSGLWDAVQFSPRPS